MTTKFQYRVMVVEDLKALEHALNHYADEGWELSPGGLATLNGSMVLVQRRESISGKSGSDFATRKTTF